MNRSLEEIKEDEDNFDEETSQNFTGKSYQKSTNCNHFEEVLQKFGQVGEVMRSAGKSLESQQSFFTDK